ncbi:Zinc finger, CCHC-type [Gossypium australe]|uniref:Zinc finger, CCHC-type n=1 Tax=Gossypium australe TaxID=47621 RepID=A0A5B6WW19_9ROSI|nr:Zinc finger, CCHC-type [Gossypium australe]
MWATKATLEKCVIWKVGTGQNILINEHAWIPDYDNIRLRSHFDNLHSDKVEALIDSNSREWNRELVVDTFQAEAADLILRIPIADEAHEDFMAWNEEPSGEYTVKSSYKLLQRSNPTAYALQTVYKDFYKKIWLLNIPTKVKVFIWRVSWNYLATLVNLMARGLATNSMCPRCGVGQETMNHLFRDCPVSKEVWMFLSDLDVAVYPQEEFVDWLIRKVLFFSLTRCQIFCVALWAIWGERNSRIHEKKCRSGRETANFVIDYVKEMDGIKAKSQHTSSAVVKWQPPFGQGIKINFDGAFDERNKCAMSGIVARDSSGRALLSSTKIHGAVESAFTAEALACRQAVQIALAIEQTDFVIEGDSLTTIKKCKQRSQDKSRISPFIHDIH